MREATNLGAFSSGPYAYLGLLIEEHGSNNPKLSVLDRVFAWLIKNHRKLPVNGFWIGDSGNANRLDVRGTNRDWYSRNIEALADLIQYQATRFVVGKRSIDLGVSNAKYNAGKVSEAGLSALSTPTPLERCDELRQLGKGDHSLDGCRRRLRQAGHIIMRILDDLPQDSRCDDLRYRLRRLMDRPQYEQPPMRVSEECILWARDNFTNSPLFLDRKYATREYQHQLLGGEDKEFFSINLPILADFLESLISSQKLTSTPDKEYAELHTQGLNQDPNQIEGRDSQNLTHTAQDSPVGIESTHETKVIETTIDQILIEVLEKHGVNVHVKDQLSPEQRRNIVFAHWKTADSLTPAKIRDRWIERNLEPRLPKIGRKMTKPKLADQVKGYTKRGIDKLGALAKQKKALPISNQDRMSAPENCSPF